MGFTPLNNLSNHFFVLSAAAAVDVRLRRQRVRQRLSGLVTSAGKCSPKYGDQAIITAVSDNAVLISCCKKL